MHVQRWSGRWPQTGSAMLVALTTAGSLLLGLAGCNKCEVCRDVGGPCGVYSLAGRGLPTPPLELHPDAPLGERNNRPKPADEEADRKLDPKAEDALKDLSR